VTIAGNRAMMGSFRDHFRAPLGESDTRLVVVLDVRLDAA
jgi:hypothetical protein